MTGVSHTSTQPLTERLRAAGAVAWSVVGLALLVALAALLVVVLRPIVLAVLVALFVAIVFGPFVDVLARRRVPRGIGAAAAVLIVVGIGFGVTVLVVRGIASQWPQISQNLNAAVGRLHTMLSSVGLDGDAAEAAQRSVGDSAGAVRALLVPALGNLLGGFLDLALAVLVALFVCFFLLKDGHAMAARAARSLPLPRPLADGVLAQAASTVRRYFVGLTVLGAFNAVVVVAGALALHVPLVAAIAVITLLGSYVPYLGAPIAGAFAVLIALGAAGPAAAAWMLLVVLLANTVLQYLVSPFAYGAALRLSPLTVLLVTLTGGALAGVAGLTLAAPVTAVAANCLKLVRPREPDPGAAAR